MMWLPREFWEKLIIALSIGDVVAENEELKREIEELRKEVEYWRSRYEEVLKHPERYLRILRVVVKLLTKISQVGVVTTSPTVEALTKIAQVNVIGLRIEVRKLTGIGLKTTVQTSVKVAKT